MTPDPRSDPDAPDRTVADRWVEILGTEYEIDEPLAHRLATAAMAAPDADAADDPRVALRDHAETVLGSFDFAALGVQDAEVSHLRRRLLMALDRGLHGQLALPGRLDAAGPPGDWASTVAAFRSDDQSAYEAAAGEAGENGEDGASPGATDAVDTAGGHALGDPMTGDHRETLTDGFDGPTDEDDGDP